MPDLERSEELSGSPLAAQVRVLRSDPSAVSDLEPDFPFLPASGRFSCKLMLLHVSHVITSVILVAPGTMRTLRQLLCLFFLVHSPQSPSTALGRLGRWGARRSADPHLSGSEGNDRRSGGRRSRIRQAFQQTPSWGFPP